MNVPKSNKNDKIPQELEIYFENKFCSKGKSVILSEDHEFSVDFFCNYLDDNQNTFQILKNFYPQLYFPIEAGINNTEEYINSVLKGKDSFKNLQKNLELNDEEGINIKIYKSFAGKIPVLSINNSKDFSTIVQSLLYKNNPVSIPQSMGAFLAKGINNWARIHTLKKQWLENNAFGNWSDEFLKNILPNPDLFKDKIIVLSTKPYSNISSEKLNLFKEDWKTYSLSIRLEHECTHLYTLKRYGHASNNLHDELIADYIGISKTLGAFNKEWILLFLGLEDYPNYRKGARLQNYLGNIHLSGESFVKLIEIIKDAIESIAAFDKQLGRIISNKDQICRIEALCETDLLKITSKNGCNMLMNKYNEKQKAVDMI